MRERFYLPLETALVRTVQVSRDPTVRSPFVTQTKAVVAIGRADVVDGYPRVQLSDHHGRAIIDPRMRRVLWGDQYGTLFGAKDWKGTIMEQVVIHDDSTSPYGLRAQGLKDNIGLGRIGEASRIMRENGLPTEVLVRVRKLREIWIGGKLVPVGEWKAGYLKSLDQDIEVAKGYGKRAREGWFRKKKREVQGYFKKSDFYIIERDLQVGERLCDIGELRTEDDFTRVVAPIFRWVNAVAKAKGRGLMPDTEQPPRFDYSQAPDVKRYFLSWLPEQMGIYLARFHALKLFHNYATNHNWSAVGVLCDLDSVRGVPLGNRAPRLSDYERDCTWTGQAIKDMWGSHEEGRENYLVSFLAPLLDPDPLYPDPKMAAAEVCKVMSLRRFNESYRQERARLGLRPLHAETF
ncbi:MAG: hypothetical protein HY377_02140 [Candidatus Blackburnbacteria bacterium]|nr:hypothetical protein [Candidatus Blackburnbacteria bacterium]